MMYSIEQIAKTAHLVHITYCKHIGSLTQPEWSEVSPSHKNVVYSSINKIIKGELKSVEDSHDAFVKYKYSQGWGFSETYSLENKTNPRLVAFERLSLEQRIKESLFFECVKSFI